MAVPAFWATPFSYTEINGVTDVNSIIAGVHTALTSLSSPWTDESGAGTGPWRSPARSDGISFKIGLTRVSATRIQVDMWDQIGTAVNTTDNYFMDIDAAGNQVQVFAGTLHFALSSARPTYESMYCGVLDQSPEPMALPQAMYIQYVGPRTSDGALRNYGWHFHCRRDPNGTTYSTGRQVGVQRMNGGGYHRMTMALTLLPAPAEYCDSSWTPPTWYGRMPQSVVVEDRGLAAGAEVTVPIDAGVIAVFKLLGCGSYSNQKIAFRKS